MNVTTSVPIKPIFLANQRFFGARANNFWRYGNHSFRKFDKFVEISHKVYFNNELVQNLEHINIPLEHWAQLFQKNLGTHRLAQKLEGTLVTTNVIEKKNNVF